MNNVLKQSTRLSNWEKVIGFIFGVVFIATLLALNVVIPDPTPSQYATFKTVLALAAAGVGGIFAGFIHVKGTFQKMTVRAGGALALFLVVFFLRPLSQIATILFRQSMVITDSKSESIKAR